MQGAQTNHYSCTFQNICYGYNEGESYSVFCEIQGIGDTISLNSCTSSSSVLGIELEITIVDSLRKTICFKRLRIVAMAITIENQWLLCLDFCFRVITLIQVGCCLDFRKLYSKTSYLQLSATSMYKNMIPAFVLCDS